MAYLSIVTVKGHKYYRLVESYRENGKVKHRILVNYGSTPPEGISATPEKEVSATLERETGGPKHRVISGTPSESNRSGSFSPKDVSATLVSATLSDHTIILPADLLSRIETIEDVKLKKVTRDQWVVSKLTKLTLPSRGHKCDPITGKQIY